MPDGLLMSCIAVAANLTAGMRRRLLDEGAVSSESGKHLGVGAGRRRLLQVTRSTYMTLVSPVLTSLVRLI